MTKNSSDCPDYCALTICIVAIITTVFYAGPFVQSTSAQEKKTKLDGQQAEEASDSEKLTDLQKQIAEKLREFDASMKKLRQAEKNAKSSDDRLAAAKLRPDIDAISQELLELATANPADPAAIDAVTWILQYNSRSELVLDAVKLTREKLLANEKVHEVIAALVQVGTVRERVDAFKTILSKNEDRTSRGLAVLALGILHEDSSDEKEAMRFYKLAMKEYADIQFAGQDTIGDIIGPMLFALEHLRVGAEAPDIDGEDLDGDAFKLSDYRGKVVVLDFWGHW